MINQLVGDAVYMPDQELAELVYTQPIPVAGVAVLQMRHGMFPSRSFGKYLPSELYESHVRVMGAMIETAKEYGGTIVFEQLVSTTSEAIRSPRGLRVFLLAESPISMMRMEQHINALCSGEDEEPDTEPGPASKKQKRGGFAKERVPVHSHLNLRVSDLRKVCPLVCLAASSTEQHYVSYSGSLNADVEDGSEPQLVQSNGFFHSFDIVSVINRGNGAQQQRAKTWGIDRPTVALRTGILSDFLDYVVRQLGGEVRESDVPQFYDRCSWQKERLPDFEEIADAAEDLRLPYTFRERSDHGAVCFEVQVQLDGEEDWFDPCNNESYLEIDEDTGVSEWHPSRTVAGRKYVAANMYYMSFSDTPGVKNTLWFPGTADFFRSCMLPWERPSADELKAWLSAHVGVSGNDIEGIELCGEEKIRELVANINPWKMASPVKFDHRCRPFKNNVDRIIKPMTDRMHVEISARIETAEAAIKAGTARPEELDMQYEWALAMLRGFLSLPAMPNYTGIWHELYSEFSAAFSDMRRSLNIRNCTCQLHVDRLKKLRRICYNPVAGAVSLHPHCADAFNIGNCMWQHRGFSRGQVAASVLLLTTAGMNWCPLYAKNGTLFKIASHPGAGKSYWSIEMLLHLAQCGCKKVDFMTAQAMKYDTEGKYDLKLVWQDEAEGQESGTASVMMVRNIELMVTQGWFNTDITDWNPERDESGRMVKAGATFEQSVAARGIVWQFTNGRIHDTSNEEEDRGATADRTWDLFFPSGEHKGTMNGTGAEYLKALRQTNKLVHMAVGLVWGVGPQYGLVPNNVDSTLVTLFVMMAKKAKVLGHIMGTNRSRGTFEAVCQFIAKGRIVRDYMFPGRNTEEAQRFSERRKNVSKFNMRNPFSLDMFKKARRAYVSGVDVVMAAMSMERSDAAYRIFMSLLVDEVKVSSGTHEVEMGEDADSNYAVTKFTTTPGLKLSGRLHALARANKIPGFSLHNIKQMLQTKKVGGEELIRPRTGGVGQTDLLLHLSCLEGGINFATPGQIEMLTEILGLSVWYSYDDQREAFIERGDFQKWLDPGDTDGKESTFNRRAEFAKMKLWKLPNGEKCMWDREDGSHVSLTAQVAQLVPPNSHVMGSTQARGNGPLGSSDGQPVFIKQKTMVAVLGLSLEFLKLCPKLVNKHRIVSHDERRGWERLVTRFLNCCGSVDHTVEGGDTVLSGFTDEPGQGDDIFTELVVPDVAFTLKLDNPDYIFGGAIHEGGGAASETDLVSGGLSRVCSRDQKHIVLTNASKLERKVAQSLRQDEDDRYTMGVQFDDTFSDTSDEEGDDYEDGGSPIVATEHGTGGFAVGGAAQRPYRSARSVAVELAEL